MKNRTLQNNMTFLIVLIMVFFGMRICPAKVISVEILSGKKIVTYQNDYKGLQPGESNLFDVVVKFGGPINKKINSNNVRYIYKDFHVTIRNSTEKINTIIIYTHKFIDKNGFRVGDTVNRLKAIGLTINRNTATDVKKGIVYWFRNGKIEKIVLVHKLKV